MNLVKKLVEVFLAALVRIKLARTRPKVIGITGSLGKTTTKEAIYHVLAYSKGGVGAGRVYRTPKSFNSELGLLLAIVEQKSGFMSPVKWMFILLGAVWNAFFGKGYDILVLEYGADKPGDIENLVKVAKPDIGVITHIARVHQATGQFESLEEVLKEKKKLVTCLGSNGVAILNGNDENLKKIKDVKAKTLWWSKSEKADIYAEKLKTDEAGFSATIHYKKATAISAHFPTAGKFHIDAMLPALLCGELFGISIEDGVAALQTFTLPPGRMSIIEGVNNSTLLDSSYNASPEAMKEALELLKEFPGKRKIAVIGNMNELGDYTEAAHREIAEPMGEWLDMLITVGEFAEITGEQALKNGLKKHKIKALMQATEAAKLLKEELRPGDVILFKGSQNRVRLERAVKMLMKHPERASQLLCRQDDEWEDIN